MVSHYSQNKDQTLNEASEILTLHCSHVGLPSSISESIQYCSLCLNHFPLYSLLSQLLPIFLASVLISLKPK